MAERFYFSKNIFLRLTRKSNKKLIDIMLFFLSAVKHSLPCPTLQIIYDRTITEYEVFNNLRSQYKLYTTKLSDSTIVYKKLLATLRPKLINIRARVVVIFPSNSIEYMSIFPFKLKPFYKGTYYQRVEELSYLKARVALHPETIDICPRIQTIYDEMYGARDAQTQLKVKLKTIKADIETSRIKLSKLLYGNSGLLMDKHMENPERVRDYFPAKLMRKKE